MDKKTCGKTGCAGSGTFEGDECPGSDSEDHHCVHCGALWWTDKGCSCDLCGDYWCPLGWQNTFVHLDMCEHNDSLEEYSIDKMCYSCFIKDTRIHCPEECQLNLGTVQNNYKAFIESESVSSNDNRAETRNLINYE
jgi:hypothetical protein